MGIPTVEYSTLLSDSTDSALSVAAKFARDGIIAISNIPGLAGHRMEALSTISTELPKSPLASTAPFRTVPAGTLSRLRRPKGKAASFLHSEADKDVKVSDIHTLQRMDTAGERLRDSVRTVMHQLCDTLDKTLESSSEKQDDNKKHTFLGDLLRGGQQLEHFHAYHPGNTSGPKIKPKASTVPLHTDSGFLVAFTPAAYFDTRGKEKPNASKRDFAIKFRDGTTRCVDFEPNSVVFMLGEAGKMHFDRVTKGAADHPLASIPAVSHSVTLSGSMESGTVRTWFGSMILLPDDYPISKDMKAGLLRKQAIKAVSQKGNSSMSVLPIACLGHTHDMRALMDSAGNCAEGELYCWMQCKSKQEIDDLKCASDQVAKCMDFDTNKEWTPADGHCKNCAPKCEEAPTPSPTIPNATYAPTKTTPVDICREKFCNGGTSSMHMGGFILDGDRRQPCTILLFKSWVMDSRVKMFFGAFGTLLLGIATEWCVYIRRQYSGRIPSLIKSFVL